MYILIIFLSKGDNSPIVILVDAIFFHIFALGIEIYTNIVEILRCENGVANNKFIFFGTTNLVLMVFMVLLGVIRQFRSRFLKRCLISTYLMVRTDRTNLILGFNLYELICLNANENSKSSINFTGFFYVCSKLKRIKRS